MPLATMRRRLPFWLTLSLLVVAVSATGLSIAAALPGEAGGYVAPAMASGLILLALWLTLQRRIGGNVFGELGFVYVGFLVAYSVPAALAFLGAGFTPGGPIEALLPAPAELRAHLWRHALFGAGIAMGYLLARGTRAPDFAVEEPGTRDTRALVFAGLLLAVVIPSLALLSAPVESYYDNYTRYAHLPWAVRKTTSLLLRMSLGLYCTLLVFLFRNYRRYKWFIPPALVLICGYEILYSHGARIQALIVLLQAACLYHFTVRRISLKGGLLAAASLMFLFSVIEVVRALNFDVSAARDALDDQGLQPAGELLSVFFPGLHLYAERAAGALPPREWPMFFNDFIALFTWGDFSRWNPMAWYTNYYFPNASVAPFTLGPIADSAMWGGAPDLLVRGLLNGAFFAVIMRWFVKHSRQWWGLVVYTYCFATCILTLKYSIFLHLALIEKNLIPVLLLVYAARVLRFDGLPSGPPIGQLRTGT